jgi:hypothetical protein
MKPRLLVVTCGLAAALPIGFAMVQSVSAGWVPLGDDAAIALRSYDVLTARSPLVGLPSSGPTGILTEQAYHLGPLLFWLLALPAHFLGPGALVVTVGLVNIASVIGVVGLARRRGGLGLMFAVAVALPLMLSSLPASAYSDVWNPAAPLLPFTLLIFLSWSLACGEHRLLPLAVLAASFAAQCHLTYLLPAFGALAVGLVGLALSRPQGARPWIVAAVGVALVCWSAPLVDLVAGSSPNLVLLWEAAMADEPTLGLEKGFRALVRALGVPPWWLSEPRVAIERVSDLTNPPGALRIVSALVVLALVAAATWIGRRRRRADVVAAGALVLVLCAALVQFTSAVPEASFASVGYGLWWASPVGMFAWLALGWSLATLFARAPRFVAGRGSAFAQPAGLAAALAAGLLVALGAEWQEEPYDAMSAIGARLNVELPERPTRIDAASSKEAAAFLALDLQTGAVQSLRREGRDDVTAPAIAVSLGRDYGERGADPEQVVRIGVDMPPPPGDRVILRRRVVQEPELGDPFAPEVPPERTVTISVAPTDAPR